LKESKNLCRILRNEGKIENHLSYNRAMKVNIYMINTVSF